MEIVNWTKINIKDIRDYTMILDISFKSLWTGLNFIELPHETEFVYAVKEIKSIYIEELLEEMYPNNLSYDQFLQDTTTHVWSMWSYYNVKAYHGHKKDI